MTSPITDSDFDAIMPYGATYSPIVGGSTMKTNSTNRHVEGYHLALEPGPVSVIATWTGEEQCDIYLFRVGAELLRLASIERKAGGGVRSAATVQFGALEGDKVYLYIRGTWKGTGKPTGSITVIPTMS